MFFKTISVTDIRKDLAALAEVTGDKALQITHKSQEIKVMISQERYFQLLCHISHLENQIRELVAGGRTAETMKAGGFVPHAPVSDLLAAFAKGDGK